jgi:hypothetical protein
MHYCNLLRLSRLRQHYVNTSYKTLSLNVEPTMYASQWFMTGCVYNFRFSTVCRIWDIYLAEGVKIVFRVALAIMKLNYDMLMNAGFEEILAILKQSTASLETDAIIQVRKSAVSIIIWTELLRELEVSTAIDNRGQHAVNRK